MKRTIYFIVGIISLGLGFIGSFIPLLPSFPFLMLALYCFARSSKRVHQWFKGTKLYQKNLESYVAGQGMPINAKIRLMVMITLVFMVSGFLMRRKTIILMVLGIIWLFHVLYFIFKIKTKEKDCDI